MAVLNPVSPQLDQTILFYATFNEAVIISLWSANGKIPLKVPKSGPSFHLLELFKVELDRAVTSFIA